MDSAYWINRLQFDIIHQSWTQEKYIYSCSLPNIFSVEMWKLDSNSSYFFILYLSQVRCKHFTEFHYKIAENTVIFQSSLQFVNGILPSLNKSSPIATGTSAVLHCPWNVVFKEGLSKDKTGEKLMECQVFGWRVGAAKLYIQILLLLQWCLCMACSCH